AALRPAVLPELRSADRRRGCCGRACPRRRPDGRPLGAASTIADERLGPTLRGRDSAHRSTASRLDAARQCTPYRRPTSAGRPFVSPGHSMGAPQGAWFPAGAGGHLETNGELPRAVLLLGEARRTLGGRLPL